MNKIKILALVIANLSSVLSCKRDELVSRNQIEEKWLYQIEGKVVERENDQRTLYSVSECGISKTSNDAWIKVHNFSPVLNEGEYFLLVRTSVIEK